MSNPRSLISGWLSHNVRTAADRSEPHGEAVPAKKSTPGASQANRMLDGLSKLRSSLSNCSLEHPIASLSRRTLKRQDGILLTLMFRHPADPSSAPAGGHHASPGSSCHEDIDVLNKLCEQAEADMRKYAKYRSVEPTWSYFGAQVTAMRDVLTTPGDDANRRLTKMMDTLDAEMDKLRPPGKMGKLRSPGKENVDGRDSDACRVFKTFLDVFDSKRIKPLKLESGKVSSGTVSSGDVERLGENTLKAACVRLRMEDKAQLAEMLAERKRKGKLGAWGAKLHKVLDEVKFQLPQAAVTPPFSFDAEKVFDTVRRNATLDPGRADAAQNGLWRAREGAGSASSSMREKGRRDVT
ncbi:hypothetical protein DFQ28_008356 [Apophysomyces sp. BC1034]|nr:hypothetical protein DFQ28_008356 [Apophysomyces sp. BC1034]